MGDGEGSSLNIKIGDDELKGRYSNLLRIAHTREEFILDFISVVPPQATVVARIVASPGHLKRIIAALKQNSRWDYTSMALAMLGISIPNFVLGPILVLIFSLSLYWLPPSRWGGFPSKNLILPVLTLSAIYMAYIARLTRAGMLEVLRSDYIRTARAKGLSEKDVVVKHALRGGLMPVVSFTGPALAFLLTPNGRFLSPGWRWVALVGAVDAAVIVVLSMAANVISQLVILWYFAAIVVLALVAARLERPAAAGARCSSGSGRHPRGSAAGWSSPSPRRCDTKRMRSSPVSTETRRKSSRCSRGSSTRSTRTSSR